ncbi:hypothetical protein VTK26DRAFT_2421 [Humicola hyalothermophila]
MVDKNLDLAENRRRMLAGELYYAFAPDLSEDRRRARAACYAFNSQYVTGEASRRTLVELWKAVVHDTTPLPPRAPTLEEDERLLLDYPYVEGPIKMDYGYNVKIAPHVYINSNATFLDTCPITIGARTLVGPNCSFFAATHPLDPALRNGMAGPEGGKPIAIGEDCWLGGNVTILAGVTIGRGATVGAGSVVTRDVEDYVVVAGNPARVIRRLGAEGRGMEKGGRTAEKEGQGGGRGRERERVEEQRKEE